MSRFTVIVAIAIGCVCVRSTLAAPADPTWKKLGIEIARDGGVVFQWDHDDGNHFDSYVLDVNGKQDISDPVLHETITIGHDNAGVPMNLSVAHGTITFQPAGAPGKFVAQYATTSLIPLRTYYWRVTGHSAGSTSQEAGKESDASATSFSIQPLNFSGLTFQQSFVEKNVTNLPVLSFSRPQSGSATATYNIDAAVILRFPDPGLKGQEDHLGDRFFRDSIAPFASVEAHVSGDPDPKASEHRLAAQVGWSDLKTYSNASTTTEKAFAIYWTGAGTYESSQSGDVQKVMFTGQLSPEYGPLGLQFERSLKDFSPASANDPVTFVQEDFLGIEAGGTTRGVDSSVFEKSSGICRLTIGVHPAVTFHLPEGKFPFKSITLYADDKLRYLTTTNQVTNFLNVGLVFKVNDKFGVQAYYKIGRDTPSFQKVETFNIGIGGTF